MNLSGNSLYVVSKSIISQILNEMFENEAQGTLSKPKDDMIGKT